MTDLLFAHYLLKYKSIVLQNIGTFTLTESQPTAERMGRDFQSPKSTIDFTQAESGQYRLLDVLNKEQGSETGTTDLESAENCQNYLAGIKFQIEKTGQYAFPGLGTLKATDQGSLLFESDPSSDPFHYGVHDFSAEITTRTPEAPPVVKPRKRRRRFPILLIILLLLIGGGAAAWFLIPEKTQPYIDQAMSLFEKKETTAEKPAIAPVQDTNTVVKDTIPADTLQQDTVVADGPQRYFVIAGFYATQQEADASCAKLKQKGYAQAIIVSTDRIRVAYKGFSNKDEALKYMEQTRIAENRTDIWLMTKN